MAVSDSCNSSEMFKTTRVGLRHAASTLLVTVTSRKYRVLSFKDGLIYNNKKIAASRNYQQFIFHIK